MIKFKKWFLKDWIEMFKAFATVCLCYAFFLMWLVVTILTFERGLSDTALYMFWFGSVGFILFLVCGFLQVIEASRLKKLKSDLVKLNKRNKDLKTWIKKNDDRVKK
jgi:hypothetical protein